MVEQVDSFEWIETSNEIEALVLETNLIKQHLPKYNILMKDDKNLSYIVFTGN
jgi:excinuclease ABC subunit C